MGRGSNRSTKKARQRKAWRRLKARRKKVAEATRAARKSGVKKKPAAK